MLGQDPIQAPAQPIICVSVSATPEVKLVFKVHQLSLFQSPWCIQLCCFMRQSAQGGASGEPHPIHLCVCVHLMHEMERESMRCISTGCIITAWRACTPPLSWDAFGLSKASHQSCCEA